MFGNDLIYYGIFQNQSYLLVVINAFQDSFMFMSRFVVLGSCQIC